MGVMEPEAPAARIIKRYPNRKLYDTRSSAYVTLDDIAQFVKDGEDIRILDNASGGDLTSVTLAQIIHEEEKKEKKHSLETLKGIIQAGGENLSEVFRKNVTAPATDWRDDATTKLEELLKKGGDTREEIAAAVNEWKESYQSAVTSWQTRMDEKVQALLMARSHIPALRREIKELHERIDSLERRLAKAEEKRRKGRGLEIPFLSKRKGEGGKPGG